MPVDQVPPGGPRDWARSIPDPHEEALGALSALVLGRLSADEQDAVLEHLRDCSICRSELPALEEARAFLDSVPPEAFLDGPPENAELLMRRTVRAIRDEDDTFGRSYGPPAVGPIGRSRGRIERAPGAPSRLLVAAAVLVAAGVGLTAGRLSMPNESTPSVAQPAESPAVPGTVTAVGTEASTGASLAVEVVPAKGWVRLNNVTTDGIPEGTECRLVVIDQNGDRIVGGSWLVSAPGEEKGPGLQGMAAVEPDQVDAVRVETTDGEILVTADV